MTPRRIDPDITVEVDGLAWTRVESLRRARPDERVFAVTTEEDGTTEVRFGDGQRGLRPPANSTVKVTPRKLLVIQSRMRGQPCAFAIEPL